MPTFSAAPYGDTFARAEAFLAKGRNKQSRPLANNTRMVRVDDDAIAVVLHNTAVVTFHRSGEFTIYGGGWNTVTTKERIRRFSPASPSSDGHGGWVVGYTGEITPPRVQKCRSCKGRGRWMEDDYCHGPSTYWGPNVCSGGTVEHDIPVGTEGWWESRRDVPCEHGKKDRHATQPCEHGDWGRHRTGESERQCYRCDGEGRTDYGSKPVPITVMSSQAYRVDAEGKFLGMVAAPGYVGSGYALASYPTVAMPSKHDVGASLVDDLASVLPNVKAGVTHPISGERLPLNTAIVSLNDTHKWTRERIADWLDTLDLDLRFTA